MNLAHIWLGAGGVALFAITHGAISPVPPAVGRAIGTVKEAGANIPPITGSSNPEITQANIDRTICVGSYAHRSRSTASYEIPTKQLLMQTQKPGENPADFELDQLIPASIGGNADARNLWLQPVHGMWTSGEKNALEYVLWHLVCRHEVTLATAQHAIATDWISAFQQYATSNNLNRFHYNQEVEAL